MVLAIIVRVSFKVKYFVIQEHRENAKLMVLVSATKNMWSTAYNAHVDVSLWAELKEN